MVFKAVIKPVCENSAQAIDRQRLVYAPQLVGLGCCRQLGPQSKGGGTQTRFLCMCVFCVFLTQDTHIHQNVFAYPPRLLWGPS